jgi:hypothetical protein
MSETLTNHYFAEAVGLGSHSEHASHFDKLPHYL